MSEFASKKLSELQTLHSKLKYQLDRLEKAYNLEASGLNEFASDAFKGVATQNQKLKYQLAAIEKAVADEEAAIVPFEFKEDPSKAVDVYRLIEQIMSHAIGGAFPAERGNDPNITVPLASVKKAGAYQCNAALGIANKQRKATGQKVNPKSVAEAIIAAVPANPAIKAMDVAGPGFINIHIAPEFMALQVQKYLRVGVLPPQIDKKRVIVDFSSPNVAKEMHVGHLRSTIIGESLCRILEFCGHDVLRLNHIGDFGTPFGMLVANLQDKFPNFKTESPPIADLQMFYKEAKERFDKEEDFKKRAYQNTVALQAGTDADITYAWQLICDVSRKEFSEIYRRLDITVTERGESFYYHMMNDVVKEMKAKGALTEDEDNPGLQVAWTSAREQTKIPMVVVKSDGAYTYSTSDLATIRQRLIDENADWIVYVVGSSQDMHFKNLFAMARDIGWLTDDKRVDHVGFGYVLGEDGKILRSRCGDTVKLRELLDEGVARAKAALESRKGGEKNVSGEEAERVNEAVAYSCIKYADLSHTRLHDYTFNYDKMLQEKGNTGVYLMYAYVRTQSILANPAIAANNINLDEEAKTRDLKIEHEKEIKLCQHLMRLPELLTRLQKDLMPDRLCDYAYNLCTSFTAFFDKCYCIRKDKEGNVIEVNVDRLLLVRATNIVLKQIYDLLGVATLDKM